MAAADTRFVNDLFRRLQAIFPAWRQAFASDDDVAEAKRQWTIGLIESGITSAETINAGLAMARKSKNPFLPSVGQFIDWCRESKLQLMNFPSLDSVIAKIINYSAHRNTKYIDLLPEIDAVSYWIYQHVDMYAVSHADAKECRRIVGIAYDEAAEKVACGYVFKEPPNLLPEFVNAPKEQTAEQREQVKQTIANLRAMFRGAA